MDFGDISPPSSQSAGFPNKVAIPCLNNSSLTLLACALLAVQASAGDNSIILLYFLHSTHHYVNYLNICLLLYHLISQPECSLQENKVFSYHLLSVLLELRTVPTHMFNTYMPYGDGSLVAQMVNSPPAMQ